MITLQFDSPVFNTLSSGAADYRVVLNTPSPLTVSLTDLQANADLFLLDRRGRHVAIAKSDLVRSKNPGATAEFFSYSEYAFPFSPESTLLPAGEYTVKVLLKDDEPTHYRLVVSNTDRPINLNVGRTESFSYRGELGAGEIDTYTFEIEKGRDYELEVAAPDIVDLELTVVGTGAVIKSERSGDDPMVVASVAKRLEPGQYQVKLKSLKDTRYILSMY